MPPADAVTGLVLGRFVGIAGGCWLALRFSIGQLPEHTEFRHIIGASLLAGIGFTMSLFIAELAFAGPPKELFPRSYLWPGWEY